MTGHDHTIIETSALETAAAPENVTTVPIMKALSLKVQIEATLIDWRRRWPAVFTTPVPLAVGIMRQIKEQIGTKTKVHGAAIHQWTMRASYLHAVARGDIQRNLDGSEAGIPDEAQRQKARDILAERGARHKARAADRRRKAKARSSSGGAEVGAVDTQPKSLV